jgi:ABC-type branched-subunit amino acid transport system ATPase component/NAD(P)H-dependent FMN reductase
MLEIANVSVSIGGTPILRDVSLTVPAASMVGLVGRNGAGKTTTMKTVMGLLKPQSGVVRFDGADITGMASDKRAALGIGFMPEDRRLVPELTVRDNMLVPAWAMKLPEPDRRLDWITGLIPELAPLMDRRAPQLSGGQQKLAALGRALMIGRRALLLDEPSEGVAPALAQRIGEILANLKREGLSVLIAESNDHHVASLLDHVHAIERGHVRLLDHAAAAAPALSLTTTQKEPEPMSAAKLTFLGISGSLRKASVNSAALRAVQALAPAHITVEIADLADIPIYNDDVRAAGYPAAVDALRAKIAAADAVIFATPEYNFSIPGVLKNAIDWASRPPSQPFDGKPIAIMGASPGPVGTARAQYDLRKMMVFLNAFPINKPEVMIGMAPSKFNDKLELTDEPTREFLKQMLTALEAWTLKLKA